MAELGTSKIYGDLTVSRDAKVSGNLTVGGGTPAAGKILSSSNTDGLSVWQTAAELGLSVTGHTHDATDVTSGTFADARIPSLAASKITSGTFEVARGGTGIASYTAGNYINAATSTTLQQRTPAQVLSDIGAASSSHTHTEADITDLGNYSLVGHTHAISDVTNLQTSLDGKVSIAGDTMTGLLILPASTTGSAALRIPPGSTPTTPTNGDIWNTNVNTYVRLNGTTHAFMTKSGGTFTGGVTFSTSASWSNNSPLYFKDTVGTDQIGIYMSAGNNLIVGDIDVPLRLDSSVNPVAKVGASSYTLWHAGNDGSGSGLDADLLDGIDSWQLLRSDEHDLAVQGLGIPNVGTTDNQSAAIIAWGSQADDFLYETQYIPHYSFGFRTISGSGTGAYLSSYYGVDIFTGGAKRLEVRNTTLSYNGNSVWHAGNSSRSSDTETVTQSSHGFSVGNALRHNGTSYVAANSLNVTNAEVLGIIHSVVDANTFEITYNGRISGLSGLTAGEVYFLQDDGTLGLNPGTVDKPILVATSTTSGVFINYRGVTNDLDTDNYWAFENRITITSNYTIETGHNAVSAGPITISDGVTVTVPDGSTWTVV